MEQPPYQHFMRPDPDQRRFLGPIEEVDDELTGRRIKTRSAKIGMVRGASEARMREIRVYLNPVPHIRLDKGLDLQGWYQDKHNVKKGSRIRPCFTDALLTQPYGGYCPVGCAFCYINSGFRGYRGSGLASVPVKYGDQVRRQLASMRVAAAGYFSSFTEPFLPLEDWYHNTQEGAKAFVEAGLPIFFLSRLSYPSWAIDLLKLNPYSYAQKSINTPDEKDWKKLSPGAISLPRHFQEIRELRRQGIYVSIQVNPVVPGIVTHEDVEELLEMFAYVGANHVIVKFVEGNTPWAGAMATKISERFDDTRAGNFRDLFIENQCGGQRTISEAYRLDGHRRYQRKATKLGLTYSTCYEYGHNPDGSWRNLGLEFTTADQCHGQRVPMFTKGEHSRTFREIEECPPSGCLLCTDNNGGKPRCGFSLLGEAKALRLSDFRRQP